MALQTTHTSANVYHVSDMDSTRRRNNNQLPVYQDPPATTTLRNQIQDNGQFQYNFSTSKQSQGKSKILANEDVIYAKPSLGTNLDNDKHSASIGQPKLSQSITNSSLGRDQSWKIEADQTSTTNLKSNSLRRFGQDYLQKANSVYQNDPTIGIPSSSNNPSAHNLSRQSSAFSSYSRQKDTLV